MTMTMTLRNYELKKPPRNVGGAYVDERKFHMPNDIFEKDFQICTIHSSHASH